MQNIRNKIYNYSVENAASMLTILPISAALGDLINSCVVNISENIKKDKRQIGLGIAQCCEV